MRHLFYDFETRSSVDIGKCGLYKYMSSPDFSLLLLAYAFDDEPVHLVDFTLGEDWPADFLFAITDPGTIQVMHNCQFERNAVRTKLGIEIPAKQCIDTMILAASCGLPLSLGDVCTALGMGEEQAKMKEGKALIRKFCLPRRPTKTNPKLWHEPDDYPEDWDTFCRYCIRDVESERSVYRALEPWLPSQVELDLYDLDSRINEKGIRSDVTLAQNAMDMDERYKAELTEKAVQISGLENPNSVAQIKYWLQEQEGLEVPTLNKKVVADVVSSLKSEDCKKFMAIRTELSKTSTKKYEAFIRCAGEDDHIRGCFQMFGGHTGRWAGRLVQLQNLVQNHMEDLDDAREIVKDGDYDFLRTVYPSVTNTLSELIRTTLIPEDGEQFIVADFSAIEARVSAYLAGEEWVLEAFRAGKDIYCATASQMFGVPVEKNGINGELRAKGKIATLACIAKGQLVLTDHGLIPIENVTTARRVWDGEEWVSHDGVIYKGEKQVITYDGLTATGDHVVWVEGQQRPVYFRDAASRGLHLAKTGDGWTAVRARDDYLPRETVDPGLGSPLRTDEMCRLRCCPVDISGEPAAGKEPRVPELLASKTDTELAESEDHITEATVREPQRSAVQELRGEGNYLRLPECNSRWAMGHPEPWAPGNADAGAGPDQQRPRVCPWEPSVGGQTAEHVKPEMQQNVLLESSGVAVCKKCCEQEAAYGPESGRDPGRGLACSGGETEELEKYRAVVPVYDILNAGPKHRFTVSDALVSNCGYGGGVGSLKAFGADKMGLSNEEMAGIIDTWREANPHIVAAWKSLNNAVVRCIRKQVTTIDKVCGIRFRWDRGIMWMRLPSGREMAYYHPEYTPSEFNKEEMVIAYWGMNQTKHKWSRIETRGSRIFENLVQATARDCLRDTMLRLDAEGWDIRAHVHDEIICTEPIDGRSVDDMAEVFSRPIDWAPGLPLTGAGYSCSSYRKD